VAVGVDLNEFVLLAAPVGDHTKGKFGAECLPHGGYSVLVPGRLVLSTRRPLRFLRSTGSW
jgi:hypothetical protein